MSSANGVPALDETHQRSYGRSTVPCPWFFSRSDCRDDEKRDDDRKSDNLEREYRGTTDGTDGFLRPCPFRAWLGGLNDLVLGIVRFGSFPGPFCA